MILRFPKLFQRRANFDDLSEHPDSTLLPPLDRPDVERAALSDDHRSWVDQGVVIKRKFIPDDLLDPYIERRAAFRPNTIHHLTGWFQGNCYEGIPEMRRVALYPPLMTLMESLIGEPMLFHLALPIWVSSNRNWHQDDYLNPDFINTWYAAVWIALETIEPDVGPFEYIPGSHRWPLLRGEKVRGFLTDEERQRKEAHTGINEWPKYAERFVTPAIERKIRDNGLAPATFLAEKGDVLIWHARLMHRAMQPRGEKVPRRSLITHYSGINHRPDMILREQDENGQSFAVFKTPLELD